MDVDQASTPEGLEQEFWQKYFMEDQCFGVSTYGNSYRAVCTKCEDIIMNCRQQEDGYIACTSLSGDIVASLLVPLEKQPFDDWIADALVASYQLVASYKDRNVRLCLIDPNSSIFCTRKVLVEYVCIKQRKFYDYDDDGVSALALREVAIQKDLMHSNLVRMLDYLLRPAELFIVYEFMEINLRTLLKRRLQTIESYLSPQEIKHFMVQMMSGVRYLHARGIMHRDLKVSNLYINGETLKIGGFCLARVATATNRQYTHKVVSVWYRAPEILLGSREVYGFPIDMWSCGCCCGEMACSFPLFPGDSEIHTIFKIFQKLGTPIWEKRNSLCEAPDFKFSFPMWKKKPWSEILNLSTQLGEAGLELLDGLLRYDPSERLSAEVCLRSRYLAD